MKILIFSAIEGHTSLAQALDSFFKGKKISSTIYCHDEPILALYRPFYRSAPSLLRFYYRLQFFSWIKKTIFRFTLKSHAKPTIKQIETIKPDVVITTSWSFNQALEKLKTKYNYTFVSLITDPRTFFPINVAQQADLTCVFDDYQAKLIKKSYPQLKTVATGWFVKPEFEKKFDQQKVRQELSLENKLTFLFTTGWEGTEVVFELIKAIAKLNHHLQIIIACGTNQNLFNKIKNLKQKQSHSCTQIIPLSFTKHLHDYMYAADLVVGKAGPNTIFEAVATLTPFFASTHISGQENGNLEIIKEYKLGFVEENFTRAFLKLTEIIENPRQLEVLKPHLEKMAQYNRGSKKRLFEALEKLRPN